MPKPTPKPTPKSTPKSAKKSKHRSKRQRNRTAPALPTLYVFTRDSIRELDRRATTDFGLPGLVLMENAARHAADVALDLVEPLDSPRVLIVTGTGNNAGDGFAAARHLSNAAILVHIALLAPRATLSGDAGINARITQAMGIPSTLLAGNVAPELRRRASQADLIIDAMLGTGLDRPLEGRFLAAVRAINAARAGARRPMVLALDIPSGLDAESGQPRGDAVRADATITFAGLKRGFLNAAAAEFLGGLIVGDIGVPGSLLAELGTELPLEARYHRPRA